MQTYYNVIGKDGKELASELSKTELATYIIDHPKMDEYELVPIEDASPVIRERKVRSEKEKKVLLITFMRTLNFGQKNDIKLGHKIIKYGERLGYYLQLVKDEDRPKSGQINGFFTPQIAIKQREEEVLKLIREFFINNRKEVYESFFSRRSDFDEKEFYSAFNTLIK